MKTASRHPNRNLLGALAASGLTLAVVLWIGGAQAATTTTTFDVNAQVLSVCSVTATDLDFGTYNASSVSADTASSTVTVTCTDGEDYTVALDAGTGVGATVDDRAMTGTTATLDYGLYTTGGYTTIWGDGTASTVTQGATGDGTGQDYTVFGRIPTGQYVAADNYADLITVTVTY